MKTGFKEPNRKSPRFRKKVERAINRDFFNKLMKIYPDLSISVNEMKSILKAFHDLCTDVISSTRDGLELPEQLGYILVAKCKVEEFYSPDINTSIKFNMKIDHKNWNSNGWICKVYYSNFASKYRFKNAKLWAFESGRELKKKTSKAFSKNHTKYIISNDYNRINNIFREANKKLKIILQQKKENLDE